MGIGRVVVGNVSKAGMESARMADESNCKMGNYSGMRLSITKLSTFLEMVRNKKFIGVFISFNKMNDPSFLRGDQINKLLLSRSFSRLA